MGVFDNNQANKKYNDATPNYDVDDGVDIVPCNENCRFKDEEKNRCVFETCILNQYPFSIPFHQTITKTCDVCGNKYTIKFDDTDYPMRRLWLGLCDNCIGNIKSIILNSIEGIKEDVEQSNTV